MAKTIKDAQLVITHPGGASGVNHLNVVHATVVMPVSEYQAFIDLGDLTNEVPSPTTTHILSAGDTGAAD